jgi:hypothetical protein
VFYSLIAAQHQPSVRREPEPLWRADLTKGATVSASAE